MAFVVEDGTGLPNSNSYVSLVDAESYFEDRGNAAWTGEDADLQSALVRATAFIDSTFRNQFPGYRANRRLQALEWPRAGAYYYVRYDPGERGLYAGYRDGYDYIPGYDFIAVNVIPIEVKNATCEAAVRELVSPGVLEPDLDTNGAVRSHKAGDTQIVYAGATTLSQIFPGIFSAIAPLVRTNHTFSARAVRG